jgi:superfamily II DNA or RNA helicase
MLNSRMLYKLDLKGTLPVVRIELPGPRRIPYLDSLKGKGLASELLIKIHLRANGGASLDTLSFQEIILPSNCVDVIRAMIASGNLSFKGQKLVEAPKASLQWTGELHSERSGTYQCFLSEVPLQDVQLLFPQWAIVSGKWMEIETDVSWKVIESFKKGPLLLEGLDKKRFLEEDPPLVYASVFERKQEILLKPNPIVALSDGTACFANLFIDYPGVGRIRFDDLSPQVSGRTRMKKEEASFEKDLVESGYARKIVGSSNYYSPSESARKNLQFLLEMGWDCIDMQGRKILLQSGVDLQVTEDNGQILVKGCVHYQDKIASLHSAQKGRLLQEIDGSHVGLLEPGSVPVIEGVWDEKSVSIPKHKIGDLAPLFDLPYAKWDPSIKQAADCLKSGDGFESVPLIRFEGTLLPYQKIGVEWLSFLKKWGFSALLSDEMGLGKTVQVLAFFSSLRTNLPILIVAPTSLIFNWKREIEKFWPSANVYIHQGPMRLKHLQDQAIVLTSYAVLRIDQELFSSSRFEAIALDESQAIKSPISQVAKAAFQLNGAFKIAISGTPVENRSEELWSQFRYLMPDLLGDKGDFQRLEAETIRRRIKPFVLRRKKADVQIELPEKIDQNTWVALTDEQQSLYDGAISAFKNGLMKQVEADGVQAHRMEILEVILRLRQICCDPRLVGGLDPGGKAELIKLFADELVQEGKKGLIFSQFTSFLRLIQKDLREIGIEPLYLDGSIPASERGEIVRRFQEDDQAHIFLLSLKAGGVGLNLTAAESVILLDPWWNEAVERQAIDRAHRIGQKNALMVSRYLTPDAIEEKMLGIKARKTAIADQLLFEEGSNWTADDLLDLLNS